ncbi:dentin sialophosphoprotein-like protein [Rhynchospora pubera]|uniref:Dentin sialophosphoprotein-like protein n=1 Tax=Rhynchospora pubera TaxID=906938 RepID=A0AAV8GDD3_9POAL|nr:dentin sialophosphoprotein-like protein [Rhynchospora pubera]
MSLDSVVPTSLIRQLQISLRESFSLPSSDLSTDPSSSPAPPGPPLPSIQDAVASLDPTSDPSARCARCRGGLLSGGLSSLCVYCGDGFMGGGDTPPPEISFLNTNAYKLLLESLGFDGSEAVNLEPESTEPNKEQDPPKAGMILSDLLNLKLVFSPVRVSATSAETKTAAEPGSITHDLNLSGINVDAVFRETKKERPQIKITKSTQNQVPQTSGTSSFAKWDADFAPQPINPPIPVQVSLPASENLAKANLKREVSEIETQADEEPDDWQDFTGSRAAHNMADSVQIPGPSVENREPLKAEGEKSFGSKDVASSGLDQSGLSDPGDEPKTTPKDTLQMETTEALNPDGEDAFGDWNAFASSSSGQEGLPGAGLEPELGLPEPVSVKNVEVEPLNPEDDMFGDWRNFTDSGVAQSTLPVTGENVAPISGDLFPVNIEKETVIVETANVDDSFDDWKGFAESGLSKSRLSDLDEKSKTSFWDPLTPKKIEEGNTETFNVGGGELVDDFPHFTGSGVAQIDLFGPEVETQPSSQDPLNVKEIEPSNSAEMLHVKLNDSFSDWKDFTNSNAVQPRLWNDGESAEPMSGDLFPISTTEQLSNDIGASNVVDVNSFDDWNDFTSSSAVQPRLQNNGEIADSISGDPLPISTTEQPSNNVGTSNPVDDDSFDDWNDFTSSSAVDALPDSRDKNEPALGNPSENFGAWPMVGAESKKDSDSTDLWSAGVNGGVPNSVSNNSGNTDLSDGWLDIMSPSQVTGTSLKEGVKINDGDKGLSDNWLDFAGLAGPTKTKSEKVDLENNNPDDLFQDWPFTGSSQSVKPHSNLIEKNSKVGELKDENLSEDWLDFSGSGESKECIKSENNSTSDGWLNFSGAVDVKGPESKSLSENWQGFTSTGHVAAPHNTQDIDFGDFVQSSSSATPTNDVNLDSLNGVHSDPFSILTTPSNSMLYPSSNPNGDSKTGNVDDIQKYLSQMSDLSFMLKDELSIPDKFGSK